MTDREKLVELLLSCDEVHERDLNDDWEDGELEAIADHLIAHGVTVKEPLKPLTVEILMYFHWEIWSEWWIELKSGRLFCAKESKGYIHTPKDEYGKTWRCWKEKPTDEEREAAEWERGILKS